MQIIIPGEPLAQARMRLFTRHGISRVYDPQSREKKHIVNHVKRLYNGPLLEHPCISFIFHMPIPNGITKKVLPLYISGCMRHEKKPDIDNLIKLYLDCIDNICFKGDQKVSLGPCLKLYHPEPKTIIIIEESDLTLCLSAIE